MMEKHLKYYQMKKIIFDTLAPKGTFELKRIASFTSFWVSWAMFFIRDDSKIVVMDAFLKLGVVIHLLSIVTQ